MARRPDLLVSKMKRLYQVYRLCHTKRSEKKLKKSPKVNKYTDFTCGKIKQKKTKTKKKTNKQSKQTKNKQISMEYEGDRDISDNQSLSNNPKEPGKEIGRPENLLRSQPAIENH